MPASVQNTTPRSYDEQSLAEECLVQAMVVDWFSQLFIAPPRAEFLQACQTMVDDGFLVEFGKEFNASDLTAEIAKYLRAPCVGELEPLLSQQYVQLFDGLLGPESVHPYESYYQNAKGRLFQAPYVEMMDVFKNLDVSLSPNCKEPLDHVGLELAALAEALRQQNFNYISQISKRLAGWVPMMSTALHQVSQQSFYAKLLDLLVIYLSSFASLGLEEVKAITH